MNSTAEDVEASATTLGLGRLGKVCKGLAGAFGVARLVPIPGPVPFPSEPKIIPEAIICNGNRSGFDVVPVSPEEPPSIGPKAPLGLPTEWKTEIPWGSKVELLRPVAEQDRAAELDGIDVPLDEIFHAGHCASFR